MLNQTDGSTNAWFPDGELWLIHSIADGKTARFRTVAGFALIQRLIETPGHEFHALDMVGAHEISTALPMADRQTLDQFRQRLAEIDHDLDEAESFNDPSRADLLLRDREELLTSLRALVGMGGKARSGGSDSERARVRVTRAIRAAIDRMQPELPRLAEHLTARIRTGTFCSYLDDALSPVSWNTDGSAHPSPFGVRLPAIVQAPTNLALPSSDSSTSVATRIAASVRLLPEELDRPESVAWLGAERFLGDSATFDAAFVGVLLATGAAGTGKSRLLREIGRQQAAAGCEV